MKHLLILENSTSSLDKLPNKYVLRGEFTRLDTKNRNERIYTAQGFLPAMEALKEEMQTMPIYGELDHPDTFDISLQKSSHQVTKLDYVKEHNAVFGEIKLLGTAIGRDAKALVDDDIPLYVSSRAAGVTEGNGHVNIKKLFTYDLVASPGFVSAKMNLVNESYGFPIKSNVRMYEIGNDSKINELFNMNGNDSITEKQFQEYSNYLVKEINAQTAALNKIVKEGKADKSEIQKQFESIDSLHEAYAKITSYLDYLSTQLTMVVTENKALKNTTKKLIGHNDYIVENLEKSIKYSNYLAENLDKSIDYSQYIAENLDKSIDYSQYIAENLDKNIGYSKYLAEHLDNSIVYSEYLAENLEQNISYSKYIAENLDNTMVYSQYIAENLDKNIQLSGAIVEKLKSNTLNENFNDDEISMNTYGFDALPEEEMEEEEVMDDESVLAPEMMDAPVSMDVPTEEPTNFDVPMDIPVDAIAPIDASNPEQISIDVDVHVTSDDLDLTLAEPVDATVIDPVDPVMEPNMDLDQISLVKEPELITEEPTEEIIEEPVIDPAADENIVDENEDEVPTEEEEQIYGESTNLSKQIDKLIEEATKRTVSETSDLHFLTMLSKSQADHYFALTVEQQELVKVHLDENKAKYFSANDVLRLMSEALTVNNETFEEKLIRLQPENIKSVWTNLNENVQKAFISQAKLYPSGTLVSEEQIENFWFTRSLKTNESTKKLVNHDTFIQEDKLSDDDVSAIMERFRSI